MFSKENKVVDAVPADDSYTHTMIEMFMVEANEAVASLLVDLDVRFIGRIHPDPDEESGIRDYVTSVEKMWGVADAIVLNVL